MAEPTRPHLRAVSDDTSEPDQVPRKLRFQAAHPDVDIVLRGYWKATIPPGAITGADRAQVITRYHLRDLLDLLEAACGPPQRGPAPSSLT